MAGSKDSLSGKRIWVVEDNADLVNALKQSLEAQGAQVETFDGPLSASARLHSRPGPADRPDLIITDYDFSRELKPGQNPHFVKDEGITDGGLAVIDAAKIPNPPVPVIVYSNMQPKELRVSRSRDVTLVPKTVSVDALVEQIAKKLSAGQERQ